MYTAKSIYIELTYADGNSEEFFLEAPDRSITWGWLKEKVQPDYLDRRRIRRRGYNEYRFIARYHFSHHRMILERLLIAHKIVLKVPSNLSAGGAGYMVHNVSLVNRASLTSALSGIANSVNTYRDSLLLEFIGLVAEPATELHARYINVGFQNPGFVYLFWSQTSSDIGMSVYDLQGNLIKHESIRNGAAASFMYPKYIDENTIVYDGHPSTNRFLLAVDIEAGTSYNYLDLGQISGSSRINSDIKGNKIVAVRRNPSSTANQDIQVWIDGIRTNFIANPYYQGEGIQLSNNGEYAAFGTRFGNHASFRITEEGLISNLGLTSGGDGFVGAATARNDGLSFGEAQTNLQTVACRNILFGENYFLGSLSQGIKPTKYSRIPVFENEFYLTTGQSTGFRKLNKVSYTGNGTLILINSAEIEYETPLALFSSNSEFTAVADTVGGMIYIHNSITLELYSSFPIIAGSGILRGICVPGNLEV